MALSNWQFTRSARLQQRVVPWATLGLAEGQTSNPATTCSRGSARASPACADVHVLDTAEARLLAERAGLAVTELFSSDGRSNKLAEYVVMRRV